jgi:hypothetical protein
MAKFSENSFPEKRNALQWMLVEVESRMNECMKRRSMHLPCVVRINLKNVPTCKRMILDA